MGTDLRRRVQNNAAARQEGGPSLTDEIRRMESGFAMAMPRGNEATQLIRDALTCLRTNPKLADCDHPSVLGSLMTCAQLGLRPGVAALGHAWILPFWNKKRTLLVNGNPVNSPGLSAQLIVGYQGYADLANRSGKIASMSARTVYENDVFDIDYGLNERLVHVPARGQRGDAIGYYSIVKTTGGGAMFEHLWREEAEEHRDKFAMARYKDRNTGAERIIGPWADHFDRMAEKTAFLRMKRWIPKSTELIQAFQVDGAMRVDLTPKGDPGEVSTPIGELTDTSMPIEDNTPVEEPPSDGRDLWAQEDQEKNQ